MLTLPMIRKLSNTYIAIKCPVKYDKLLSPCI